MQKVVKSEKHNHQMQCDLIVSKLHLQLSQVLYGSTGHAEQNHQQEMDI